jgi:UDP:flavonoid glycosyltransferase YjiC (YdhE family)
VLGRLPGNVLAAPFVPHDLLLPFVDVMITNGGYGGVLAAVHAGVPLIVAGNTLDKPEVARRVAWSGVGLNLRTGRPSPAKLGTAVTKVLGQPALRERAAELGTAMTAAGGAPTVAKLVLELL